MNTWKFIHDKLTKHDKLLLLWVVESEGSSPGRRGFKMAVTSGGEMHGSIGGGIMEFKLVEKAKALLAEGSALPELVIQYHDKEHAKDQSGMICSGKQTVLFLPVGADSLPVIEQLLVNEGNRKLSIIVDKSGMGLSDDEPAQGLFHIDHDWNYVERVNTLPVIHIIGGGHVGLALSELMRYLDFYVKIYDNRAGLNTLESNSFAHEKIIVSYDDIGDKINAGADDFCVIMTMGYRDDLLVFKQLVHKKFFYFGMLGSESKIDTLYMQLEQDGFDSSRFSDYFIPVGLNIYSKTPKEIAVSIAAQIILQKNIALPTGRKQKPAMNEN
jgi:xanthine dehydrogenase accessory factor